MESALQARAESSRRAKDRNNNKRKKKTSNNNNRNKDKIYQACPHYKKTNYPQMKCWWRPDVKCRKCGKIGHIEHICKS